MIWNNKGCGSLEILFSLWWSTDIPVLRNGLQLAISKSCTKGINPPSKHISTLTWNLLLQYMNEGLNRGTSCC
ncbi:unnamed protein product [Cuscuta campestris]|uniref:Uncharacterized protein n=1 Tax=Cuscuta campestris TaxID=132261 RepID=A0A484N328_9ASTE|nr:unnamed protein product [Cuscuta campestris]